ncbi:MULTISPECIES: MFS transporter [unclassified Psychrobacillus]|uniref:MDR family MFS transporter n=1 Tax=unclassified Psychrobacillus TaxID=2636677 RepID=UPI00146BFEA1|nr:MULTISPECIES: MFS transporter [unclassified Psychrobacillus]MCM3359310.1 MFS transporter [Psychrobacillus sp. MER TA 171]NME06275.1 MFS transporter [Psychrobacillus sp. BL-248-WT-3]
MPKAVWLLIIGMFINTLGNSFLWPLHTIYMHDYLGQSLTMAGLVLMLNAGTGVIGNLLGGFLFDRIGGYKSIVFGILLSILSLAALTVWHDWPEYVWLVAILGFSGGIIFPSMYAMVGNVWPEGGRKAFNAIYLAQNLGVAIGPALAGIVADHNINNIFGANLLAYVFFFVIARQFYGNMSNVSNHQASILGEEKKIKQMAPFYAMMIVTFGYMLTWIIYVQWTSTISTYVLDLGITLKQYSLLWTVNGILILVAQPIIKPIINRLEHKIKTQMILGLVIFMISFIVVAFAEDYTMFVTAMVILTFGEMFVWPAVPTIASQLAPKGREGFYQGIVNSMATVGRMIGPLIGGVLVEAHGTPVMILILASLIFISIITSLLYDIPLKKQAALNEKG